MLIEETIQKMLDLKLQTMARATRELLASAPSNQLSFEDKLGLLVDREWPRLVEDLAVARVSGAYSAMLAKLARIDVLVLDDFLLAPMKDSERRDILEVLEDRYERVSTVITSQVPTKTWHAALNAPTIADAICDRLVHNARLVDLRGPSMRKKKGLTPSKH
jgi:DNA replication protein DnaC